MADTARVAVAAQYASEDEAVADFDQLHEHFKGAGKHGSFDAAVIYRDKEGKLSIPERADGAKHHGTRIGLGVGLASGLLVAIFPAVALGGALLVAGGTGAGVGAVASHFSKKASRKDLEDIAELLEAGSAGVVVVVDPEESDEVQAILSHATKVTTKELAIDDDELNDDLSDAYE